MALETIVSAAVFCGEFITTPRSVGALLPSSSRLARRIADQIPAGGSGYVVELGAGTGAITRALLSRIDNPERLVCIERSPVLADLLQKRLPTIRVIEGDARQLDSLLHTLLGPDARVSHIVSSLPLRSLAPACVRRISQQVYRVLAADGQYIQFTYHMGDPGEQAPAGFRRLGYSRVWGNLPPARVDVFASARSSSAEFAPAA